MTVIRHRIISGSPPTIWTSPEGDPEKTSLIFVEDYDLILTIWTPHMDFLPHLAGIPLRYTNRLSSMGFALKLVAG